jgi:hypothetical protein
LETIPGKHSIDSLQRNSCTRNITHYKESATIRNLKPEWWGSPLAQEGKYQEKPVKIEEETIITKIQLNSLLLVCCIIIQFNSFIYVLDNSQIWPITAKH